jgi:hypothetical protein
MKGKEVCCTYRHDILCMKILLKSTLWKLGTVQLGFIVPDLCVFIIDLFLLGIGNSLKYDFCAFHSSGFYAGDNDFLVFLPKINDFLVLLSWLCLFVCSRDNSMCQNCQITSFFSPLSQ